MDEKQKIAKAATEDVTHFLEAHWPQTVKVHNVEDDPVYQAYDVDLLWTLAEHGRLRVVPIEIKGDTYDKTGNFFFEIISNESKGTPGCFLYTAAVWLFYYFVNTGRLYCLPMDKTRPWFIHNNDHFPRSRTSTPTGNSHYVTVGKLVPIAEVLSDVPGVQIYQKHGEQWQAIPLADALAHATRLKKRKKARS
jgi:hypothetical protein